MRSMRVVTQNPPLMLIVARSTAAALSTVTGEEIGPEICNIPPTKMMPLMALVTLILFEVEGYSGEQIASLQGVAVNTVWVRIHKARKKLRLGVAKYESKGKQQW